MRIGLIARAENTGLGIQTWEFARHMNPAKTLVVNLAGPRGFWPERFPGATIVAGLPGTRDIEEFLDDLDVVFTAETPYNYELFSIAERRGVATVLQYNFEFLDYLPRPRLPRPTLFAAPSSWRYRDVPFANKQMLPVPVALDRFPARQPRDRATRFLHIVGRPAIHDRNGTADLLAALEHVRSEITVTIKCQDPHYVPRLLHGRSIPGSVRLVLDDTEVTNYWDNYTGHDVLVMPRRFGGLCLPVQEALAAGMPAIMPAISPNTWLPEQWLVPARRTGSFMARTKIELHTTDHRALAARIDEVAGPDLYPEACHAVGVIARGLSWTELADTYDRTLAQSIARA